jgi:hypothetical protein
MPVLEQIPGMDLAALQRLQANAERLRTTGSPADKARADIVLLAIEVERRRRTTQASDDQARARADVEARMRSLGLRERVAAAFREHPPAAWEVEALRAVAEHPGADFHTLAKATGRQDGGYFNLAMGSLCGDREAWLGPAPLARDGSGVPVKSALLIDFTDLPAGGTGWTLKPEALNALRDIGVL